MPRAARLDAGTDGGVAHRQDAGARGQAHRSAQRVERLGQALPPGQALGAVEPHRQVAVAEVEPDVPPERPQPVHDVEGVAVQAPAARVDAVGQPERAQVRVGGDVGAVELDVVARVGHDHDGVLPGGVQHAAGQLGAARAAREDDDGGRGGAGHRRRIIMSRA